jgi:hypothetical protein
MKNVIKNFYAPANLLLDPNYGGEYAWAYNIIKGISNYFKIIAITGKLRGDINNAVVIETGITKRDFVNISLFFFKYI